MWHFFIWGVTEQWSANQFYFCVLQSKSCNILKLCPYWVLKRMICPTSNSYTRLNSLKKYPTMTCCPSLYNISHNIHWYSFMKKYPTAMTCRTSLYNISHNIHWYLFMKSNLKRGVVLPSITLDTISIGIPLWKSIQQQQHVAHPSITLATISIGIRLWKSIQKRRVVLPSITLDTISIGIHLCKSIQKGRHAAFPSMTISINICLCKALIGNVTASTQSHRGGKRYWRFQYKMLMYSALFPMARGLPRNRPKITDTT